MSSYLRVGRNLILMWDIAPPHRYRFDLMKLAASRASRNRRFQFQKCSQLFIRMHNEHAFHRRGARLQSRSFARWNPEVNRNRAGSRLLFLAEFVETRDRYAKGPKSDRALKVPA